jgi:chondroitin 4-sulfotransferase 11
MISHKHKIIFIHIPKTGGTSIDNFFTGSFQRHSCAKDYQFNLVDTIFQEYFKFTIVRNPWDLIVSLYGMITERQKAGIKATLKRFGKKTYSFEEFVKELVFERHSGGSSFSTNYSHSFTSRCQLNWIKDLTNEICMDYIIRFENLQEDFNIVCDKIGIPQQELPHKNASKHKHYTEYYDDETRQIVAEKYAKDIE